MPTPVSQSELSVFANADFRGSKQSFGIKKNDRRGHMYIIGKTGTGKSTLLETLMVDDMKKGQGFALLDPHGDLVKKVRAQIPQAMKDRVIDFDASDPQTPYGFNPLGFMAAEKRALAASGLVQVFKHLWMDSWGPRLEYILRNCLVSLLDFPNAKMTDIPKLLGDRSFRAKVIKFIRNEETKNFWIDEFEKYPDRFRLESISPIQNKVGAFLLNSTLRRIITEPEKPLNLRRSMDEGKIILVNLAKGSIGEDTANLLGSLLISRFDLAALSRSDTPEDQRRDFVLYMDEFHNFTTQSLVFMLSELRKYRLSLVLAHQYLSQLEPRILDAIMGNAGTIILFRIGAKDAEELAPEFSPEFAAADLTSLPNFSIYLRMMIDGKVSPPFSAVTLPPKTQ
ncbi:MAG: type IV secretion system DNA-binding domain-containing protein [Pyrinomonadaceae bacterium]